MKAVIFRRHGGPEVLEVAEVPSQKPSQGQILVRVKACSLNHLDLWIRQGIPAYTITLPHIAGADVAGIVEAIGSEVTGVRIGDRVLLAPGISCGQCDWCQRGEDNLCRSYGIRGAACDGGCAQWTTAAVTHAIPIPEGITFEEAAAFPLVFLTAWHMLVARAKLKAGETVLVHAAGSGVGHAAIQIAKFLKATVYTTVGSEGKVSKAKALGADAVMNTQRESFEERLKALTNGRGVNVVVEHIGPTTWEASLRVLAKGGRLVTCGATSGPTVTLDLRYVFSRHLSVLGSLMGTHRELTMLMPLLAERQLCPVVDTVFPLEQARAAQERMAARDLFGKFVLIP
jgi:NADPH:quinone reductase-like Zn-dependent oxidoreductase